MRRQLVLRLPRAVLVSLLSLSLGAACGDDLDPAPGDDGDDGDDDDGGEPEGVFIDELDGPVDVYFDAAGILHASCSTDADCFAVEGYFHAAHRFGQMDIRRRVGRGRLSALAGPITLNASDVPQRRMMTTPEGTPLEEELLAFADERTLAALEAYSRGVNAWLADLEAGRNDAALPDEYSYPIINQDAVQDDWEPVDSVACILPLVDQLTNHSEYDILIGELYAALAPDAATDLFGIRPPSQSAILPPKGVAGARADAAAQQRLRQRLARSRPLFEKALRQMPGARLDAGSTGSNNWIVAPEQAGGKALLANDPHLSLANPSIWYIVHLDAKTAGEGDIHVAGASFAGLPGVLLGQNEDIAWGATTTYFDATDVYVEDLNEARTAVIYQGKEVPIQEVDYTFEVAGGDAVTETFQFVPHHGPIIAIDEETNQALSVRWTGHDADSDINFFLGLATATSLDEARTALESVTTAGQNFVVIDRAGDIGWFPYNRLPTRPWLSPEFPSYMPLPGNGEVDLEWGPSIPYADLPQAVNPAAGYLATANNDMTGALQDGDPTNDGEAVQGLVDEGYRHQRIVERLEESSEHDLASMTDIQADVFSLLGELLTDPILALADRKSLGADAQALFDALDDWDFQCTSGIAGTAPDGEADPATAPSARGCAAFHAVWGRLRELVFGDELELAEISQDAQPSALIFLLTEPGTFNQVYWDDVLTEGGTETPEEIVALAMTEAAALLRKELKGREPADWLWGRLHTISLAADLFSAAGIRDFDSATYANDGGLFTVDVANPRDEITGAFNQTNGPSMRFACEADKAGVNCTIELPGGQRHHRDSPFYADGDSSMLQDWLVNQPVPLVFAIDEVAASAAETVRVEPR